MLAADFSTSGPIEFLDWVVKDLAVLREQNRCLSLGNDLSDIMSRLMEFIEVSYHKALRSSLFGPHGSCHGRHGGELGVSHFASD